MSDREWDKLEEMMDENKNALFYFDIVKDEIKPNDNIEDILKYRYCYKRTFIELDSKENQCDTNNNKTKSFKFK